MQAADGAKSPSLQLGRDLGQDAGGTPRTERQVHHRTGGNQALDFSADPVNRHAGIADHRTIVPARKAERSQRGGDSRGNFRRGQPPQPVDLGCVLAADSTPGDRLEHSTAPERGGRALLADHERLAVDGRDGLGQEQLREPHRRWLELIRLQQRERRRDFRRADVDPVAAPVAERPGGRIRGPEFDRQDA